MRALRFHFESRQLTSRRATGSARRLRLLIRGRLLPTAMAVAFADLKIVEPQPHVGETGAEIVLMRGDPPANSRRVGAKRRDDAILLDPHLDDHFTEVLGGQRDPGLAYVPLDLQLHAPNDLIRDRCPG